MQIPPRKGSRSRQRNAWSSLNNLSLLQSALQRPILLQSMLKTTPQTSSSIFQSWSSHGYDGGIFVQLKAKGIFKSRQVSTSSLKIYAAGTIQGSFRSEMARNLILTVLLPELHWKSHPSLHRSQKEGGRGSKETRWWGDRSIIYIWNLWS